MISRFASIIIALFLFSCSGSGPKVDIKFYAGSSKDGAMVRQQANEKILATSPEFDDLIAVKSKGLKCLLNAYYNNCSVWINKDYTCTDQ